MAIVKSSTTKAAISCRTNNDSQQHFDQCLSNYFDIYLKHKNFALRQYDINQIK